MTCKCATKMGIKSNPRRLILTSLLTAALTIACFFAAIGLCILLPCFVTVVVAAKFFRPDLGHIVSDLSAAFTVNPQNKCSANLTHFLILDGSITTERIRDLFDLRVLKCKRANGKLMFSRLRDTWTEFMGYTFWRPEHNFNVDKHIRQYDLQGELALPVPSYGTDLRRIIGPVTSLKWDSDKSPWEILVIQNYKAFGDNDQIGTVLMIRNHHALIDGRGIVTLMRQLTKCKYSVPEVDYKEPPLLVKLLAPLKVPWDMAKMLVDTHDGLHAWHGPASGPREFVAGVTEAIPITTIKAIKNKLGVSYTAILFAAVAGALEKFAQKEGLSVPEKLGVYAPLPLPKHPGGTVNHL